MIFFKVLLAAGLFGLVTSSVYAMLVSLGVVRFMRVRARREPAAVLPPLSLLKPLHGEEPNLGAHLATFFEQDYPVFEILFCARELDDAGLAIARQVAERYPSVPARFLAIQGPPAVNAKVSSLVRLGEAAAYDIFVISDSDVRVGPDYLREIAADFANPRVGAGTCLYRGVAERGFWGKLEAAGMSVEMAGGVMAASVFETMGFLLGPTMTVRRQCVNEIGGFARLAPYCSDDFLLGQWIAALGYEVVLSTHVIDHIVLNLSFSTSVRHQVRWMKSTRFSRPKGHFGTGLTFAMPYGLLGALAALALGLPGLGLILLLYAALSRAALAGIVAGGAVEDRHLVRTMLLYPLRDLMGFFFWAASYGNSTILWRGERYRLRAQGKMQRVMR